MMFSSVLFRKILFSILLIVFGFSATIYIYSVPLIRRSIYAIEKSSAKTILENIYELVKNDYLSIEAYRISALDGYKRQLKNIILFQESFLKNKYRQFKDGILTEEEAKHSALDELRTFRYGNNDYVWVSDYNCVLISHPDPRLYMADYSLVRDKYGKPIVPSVIRAARENKDGGYITYWWRRLGDERFIEKLTYSKDFPEWKWIMATGVYIDDVDIEVSRRKKRMIEELRLILRKTKISRTGYVYIFDSEMNMIIHPNSNIENTNFSRLLDPVTGKSIGKEVMAVADKPDNSLYYKWDKPDDKGRYIYDKISWVKYVKEFDWYIASSVYIDELNNTAITVRKRILMVSAWILLLCISIVSIFLNKFLTPIRRLSDMAVRVSNGDFSVRCEAASKDEIGVLAIAFNSMVARIRDNIKNLDTEVRRQTRELVRANEQLLNEIEERILMEESLRKSEERYRTILENIEDGYYEVDLNGNMEFCNDSLCRMLGYTKDDLIGINFRKYMDKKNTKKVFRTFNRTFKTGKPAEALDWELISKNGSRCFIETSVSLIKDSDGKAIGFRGIARNITERRKSQETLEYMAYHDSLTGLYNRKAFLEYLEAVLSHAKHYENEKTVFFLDLDRFKQVNDTYGHEIGDKLLKAVADRLKQSVRETDYVCRFGGDEFTVILNHMNDILPEEVAQRIRREISKSYDIDGFRIDFITPSIGISVYPRDGDDVDTLIKCADTAMYKAKEGKNQYVCYSRME